MFKSIELFFDEIKATVLYSDEILQNEESVLVPFHFHQYAECHVVVSGKCTIRTQKSVFGLKSGDICIIPRLIAHNVEDCSKDLKKTVFTVMFQNLRKVNNEEFFFFNSAFNKNDACVVGDLELCKWFFNNLTVNHLMRDIKLKSIFSLFLINIAEQAEEKDTSFNDFSESFDERIYFIEEYIKEKYREDISLKKLSECMHISERQINRILKQNSGMGFRELLIKQRITAAYELLTTTELTAFEISQKVGFESYSGFFMAFKKCFGVSPGNFRR